MRMTSPYYDDGTVTIWHGDALDLLGQQSSIDAVIADPPYASGARTEAAKSSSGAMMRGLRWNAKPIDLDQMTTTGFVWLLRHVALATYPLLPDGGSFVSFIDWRQWPNLVGALETANLRVQAMVVWDKGSMGLGNGFRVQHELICHTAKGVPQVYDRGCPNVLRFARVDSDLHPSPKPVGLMGKLIEVVTPSGGTVLDPFMGSGSTLVAARSIGRRAVGYERDERYCEIAAKRLAQGDLFSDGEAS
jgi:site-specific DNA-methyltransferase (adenine-specific)